MEEAGANVSPGSPRAIPEKAQDQRSPHQTINEARDRGNIELLELIETLDTLRASPDYEVFLFAEKDAAVIGSVFLGGATGGAGARDCGIESRVP